MILLIENNDACRQRLIDDLRWLGEKVCAYPSSRDLPPLSTLRKPVLLLTRYELPGEDGLALADRFHEAHPSVPIFLLTGAWSPYLARQAAMRSFVWVRQVPVGYAELCALIGSVCRKKGAQPGRAPGGPMLTHVDGATPGLA